MRDAFRGGIGVVLSSCAAVYGAIVGACAPVWFLGTLDGFTESGAFTLIALALTPLLIAVGAIVGMAVATRAVWKSFRQWGTLAARADISPALAERRRNAYRPLAVVAGVGAFLALNGVIASSLFVVWPAPRLHLVHILANQPIPLVVRVPLTIATLVASASIGAWAWRSMERRFLAREQTTSAGGSPDPARRL